MTAGEDARANLPDSSGGIRPPVRPTSARRPPEDVDPLLGPPPNRSRKGEDVPQPDKVSRRVAAFVLPGRRPRRARRMTTEPLKVMDSGGSLLGAPGRSDRTPAASRWTRCRGGVAVSALALVALLAACGSPPGRPVPRRSPSPRSTPVAAGHVRFQFQDTVVSASCPAGTPSDARCYSLSGSAEVTGLGLVRVGPALDVEVPPTSPLCGQQITFSNVWTLAAGRLLIQETGPRLCLGNIGTVTRQFTVVGGTQRYSSATGSGRAIMTVQVVGATETWIGTVNLG